MEQSAVDVMNSRLMSSMHCPYSGLKISPLQGPPEVARIRGFTARIYATVKKVAVAPASSFVYVYYTDCAEL